MSHLTPERMKCAYHDLTPEEENHVYHECDYCLESILMGEDLDEYELRRNPNWKCQRPGLELLP